MKTYSVNYCGKSERMVAANNKKEAALLMGVSPYHMGQYGTETQNPESIRLTMAAPFVVWEKDYRGEQIWRRIK